MFPLLQSVSIPPNGARKHDNGETGLGNLKVVLKSGDEIFLNGANVSVDRKVSLELLNRTKFILKDHMISPEEADTPLKKLYFAIQLMIVDPASLTHSKALFADLYQSSLASNSDPVFRRLLIKINDHVQNDREFHALKVIRNRLLDA